MTVKMHFLNIGDHRVTDECLWGYTSFPPETKTTTVRKITKSNSDHEITIYHDNDDVCMVTVDIKEGMGACSSVYRWISPIYSDRYLSEMLDIGICADEEHGIDDKIKPAVEIEFDQLLWVIRQAGNTYPTGEYVPVRKYDPVFISDLALDRPHDVYNLGDTNFKFNGEVAEAILIQFTDISGSFQPSVTIIRSKNGEVYRVDVTKGNYTWEWIQKEFIEEHDKVLVEAGLEKENYVGLSGDITQLRRIQLDDMNDILDTVGLEEDQATDGGGAGHTGASVLSDAISAIIDGTAPDTDELCGIPSVDQDDFADYEVTLNVQFKYLVSANSDYSAVLDAKRGFAGQIDDDPFPKNFQITGHTVNLVN